VSLEDTGVRRWVNTKGVKSGYLLVGHFHILEYACMALV
jgi:hypothetical protein